MYGRLKNYVYQLRGLEFRSTAHGIVFFLNSYDAKGMWNETLLL